MTDLTNATRVQLSLITEDEVENWFEAEEDQPLVSQVTPVGDLISRYADSQLRIVRSTIDFSLHTLRTSLSDASYINMAPVYQRRNRWDVTKRSRLIESFLMNIPIPPLFLFENDYLYIISRKELDNLFFLFHLHDLPLKIKKSGGNALGQYFRNISKIFSGVLASLIIKFALDLSEFNFWKFVIESLFSVAILVLGYSLTFSIIFHRVNLFNDLFFKNTDSTNQN